MHPSVDFTGKARGAIAKQSVQSKQADEAAREPRLVEYDKLERRANCLSFGAISCAVLTGVGAIVAMPVAYLAVSNPTARVLLYTMPVLAPAFSSVVLAYKAGQDWRAAQALRKPGPQTAEPKVVVENATTATRISDLDL